MQPSGEGCAVVWPVALQASHSAAPLLASIASEGPRPDCAVRLTPSRSNALVVRMPFWRCGDSVYAVWRCCARARIRPAHAAIITTFAGGDRSSTRWTKSRRSGRSRSPPHSIGSRGFRAKARFVSSVPICSVATFLRPISGCLPALFIRAVHVKSEAGRLRSLGAIRIFRARDCGWPVPIHLEGGSCASVPCRAGRL